MKRFALISCLLLVSAPAFAGDDPIAATEAAERAMAAQNRAVPPRPVQAANDGDPIAATVQARRARKARRSATIAARDRADAIQAARDEVARKAMLKESLEVGRVQAQIGLAQGAQMQAMASQNQAQAMAMQAQAMREQAQATASLGRYYYSPGIGYYRP